MSMLFYIKKLVRDDAEELTFDREELYLSSDNANLLTRPEMETTSVQYTEADGGEMIAQRLASYEQDINGIIAPKTTPYWTLQNELTAFFGKNHTYTIIYEKASGDESVEGELFKSGTAWISANLQVPPTPRELYSPWSVTLMVGNPGYQEYAEDAGGHEIFANTATIGLLSAATGGQTWDAVGSEWDSVGQEWVAGEGGISTVSTSTTQDIYPVWVVEGTAVNPTIYNTTTGTQASYDGSIANGQTLTVDFASGKATLDGTIVTANLSGQLTLANGANSVGFDISSGSITSSTLNWNNYLG